MFDHHIPDNPKPEIVYSIDAFHAPAIRRVARASDALMDSISAQNRHFCAHAHRAGIYWGVMDYEKPALEKPRVIDEVIMDVRNPIIRQIVVSLTKHCKGEIENLIQQVRLQGAGDEIYAAFGNETMAFIVPRHHSHTSTVMGGIRLENAKSIAQENECYEMTRISALFSHNIRNILLAHKNKLPKEAPPAISNTTVATPSEPKKSSDSLNPEDFGF